MSVNVQTKMKRSKERYNTTPRKKDMKFVAGKESNEKDDLIRSGTLTQENTSKDKKRQKMIIFKKYFIETTKI